jgi:phosphatidylserine decarboxylase
VVFGEPGAWRPCEDIVTHTTEGVETLVRLGETIGVRT